MSKNRPRPPGVIRLRGVRQNNLKNFDLDLPLNRLIVVTGLSGSGKSSLAFDTLYAEGQRRYIETFSPYARQFFDRMDKPQVDSIEGIPPAIAIEQRNSVRSTRSTVGTMTEICDYVKLLWPLVAQLHCRQCGRPVRKDPPQRIWDDVSRDLKSAGSNGGAIEALITFTVPLSEKLSLDDSLALIGKQGYQRVAIGDETLRLEEALPRLRQSAPDSLTIIQDRVRLIPANRPRFVEACEQAYHFGKGKLAVQPAGSSSSSREKTPPEPAAVRRFSNRLHCAQCDLEYREPSPALFSFNHPVGACPECRGFGRVIAIDYDLALPDRSKTLAGGAVKPWQTGQSAECQDDLRKFCRLRKVPMDVPFRDLPEKMQAWVIEGDPGYGKDERHKWPRAWYGINGYFRWLESKSYKMHVRVLLSRYRSYRICPACHGHRFQPETLLYKAVSGNALSSAISLGEFYQLPVSDALAFVTELAATRRPGPADPLALALGEVRSRLGYLQHVGLGYLTLDRPTRSLSGGETERVSLTTCLGTRLVNTLFVLDEPSVGLHPRDTARLIGILEQLRDAGNTVVVVEHEAAVMRAADQIVDLGPGHGATGGELVFQGSCSGILKAGNSLTGQYLGGARGMLMPPRRPVLADTPRLGISGATLHNLSNVAVDFPLNRLVCVTGVSGSGKTTLARDVLLPLLRARLEGGGSESPHEAVDEDEDQAEATPLRRASLAGWERLGRAVLVDQASLGKTPRSNPAVYIGAFDDLREVFAQSEPARQLGLNASAFSFNSTQGQCERCRGAGFEKIEMQFLSDVFVRCPDCDGRRYRPHILEVRITPPVPHPGQTDGETAPKSIGDMLESTVEEAVEFLAGFPDSRAALRAGKSLKLLEEVGLGYLKLGQPINTLSGGESQRLKLVRHLADFTQNSGGDTKPTLFLFDEPTTGLHFEDVRVLLQVFQRLVNAGHSVIIVEHNLDVIKCADWVVDLGPDAGALGGRIIAHGTPEMIAANPQSHTGLALRETLASSPAVPAAIADQRR